MTSSFEAQLCELIRDYPWLYDCSNPENKDNNRKLNSWAEIADILKTDATTVAGKWRSLRDRFTRKLKLFNESKRSGAGASITEEPQILIDLAWLKVFIKHRVTSTNFPVDGDIMAESEDSSVVEDGSPEPSPDPSPEPTPPGTPQTPHRRQLGLRLLTPVRPRKDYVQPTPQTPVRPRQDSAQPTPQTPIRPRQEAHPLPSVETPAKNRKKRRSPESDGESDAALLGRILGIAEDREIRRQQREEEARQAGQNRHHNFLAHLGEFLTRIGPVESDQFVWWVQEQMLQQQRTLPRP